MSREPPENRIPPLADAKSLRVLAHPLRVALLDALHIHGHLTATEAADIVDDSPSNVSFHLRVLGNAGLIEEAPSQDARRRPWQPVPGFIELKSGDSAESRTVLAAAVDVIQNQVNVELHKWNVAKSDAPQEWREAGFMNNLILHLTAEELGAVKKALMAAIGPYLDRESEYAHGAQPPPGSQVSRVSTFGHPILPLKPQI